MSDKERPIALKAISTIHCWYDDICPVRTDCNRNNLDAVIGQVPIPPDAADLNQAKDYLRQLAEKWRNVEEPECTRPDNFTNGEPVKVIRSSIFFVERVYKQP